MRYDTIVIGGGIAGLQASIQLGRSLHNVLVIDRRQGRSLLAKNYRNILGYPQGISGEALRQAGESQARRTGVQFLDGEVISLEQGARGSFTVSVKNTVHRYEAETIVLATGISDPFPPIPGLFDCLGESLFICPDCDGYEAVGRLTAIIGDGIYAADFAQTLSYYTSKLIVINQTQNEIPAEKLKWLNQRQIPIYWQPIERLEATEGKLNAVILTSGERVLVEKGFLAFSGAKVNSQLAQALPVSVLENGHILVDPRTKETSCRNLWAVGDVVAHSQQVAIAMGDGAQAAIWIHKRLLQKDRSSPP